MSELWKVAATRSAEFDAAALDYDRYRPRYPDALFDDLTALVSGSGASAIEIGAGTGIATVPLVERGLRVLAIEPGKAMAEILAAKLQERIELVVGRFEDWVPDRHAALVVAFNAWHWVDPAIAVDRVAHLLQRGGVLCLVWTEVVSYGPQALEECLGLHPDDDALQAIATTRLSVEADSRFRWTLRHLARHFAGPGRRGVRRGHAYVWRTHTPKRDAAIRAVINEGCGGSVTKAERANAFIYQRV